MIRRCPGSRFRSLAWAFITLIALLLLRPASAPAEPWVEVEIPGCDDCTFVNLHFITAADGWVVALRPQIRAVTHDGGDTWDSEPLDDDTYWIIRRASFHDAHEGHAPADRGVGIWDAQIDGDNAGEDNRIQAPVRFYHSVDGGTSWTLRQGEITEITFIGDEAKANEATRRYLSAIHFVNGQFGTMAGTLIETGQTSYGRDFAFHRGRALLVTRDGGATWSMTLFGEDSREQTAMNIPDPPVSISFVGERHGRILADGRDGALLFRTDDGGHSWEVIHGPPWGTSIHTIGGQAFFLTPDRGWSWGRIRGMTATTDAGRTWTNLDPLFGHSLAFEDRSVGWYHGGNHDTPVGGWPPSQNGMYITQDGGDTWTLEFHTLRGGVAQVSYEPPTATVWMYGHDALFRRNLAAATIEPLGRLASQWGSIKSDVGE